MIKSWFIYLFFASGVLFLLPLFEVVSAATLQLEPSTVATTVDKTFEVKIIVNSGGEEINAVDVFVLYDKDLLTVESVKEGVFFPTVLQDIKVAGRAYIAGMVDNPGTFKTGSGTVATLVFKAKKNGTTTLTFDCTQGSTRDSNVVKNDLNASDIIACVSNGKSTVAIGSGTTTVIAATPTPTSAPAAVATLTPTPTSRPVATSTTTTTVTNLPKSGVFDDVATYAVPGAILFIVGLGLRLIL